MTKYIAALFAVLMGGFFVPAYADPSGLPVAGTVINRSTVNSSAVITTGNTFQTVLASNLGATTAQGGPLQRQALTIQNNNASDTCWLFIGAASATKATSILLLPGGSYTRYWPFVPSDAIQATCATTSDSLYVDFQ